jgi:hypothetical protein
MLLHYKDQMDDVFKEIIRCLFWESYETHKYILDKMQLLNGI